jgi:transmembrane sensor
MDAGPLSPDDVSAFQQWLDGDSRRAAELDSLSRTMNDPALMAALRAIDTTQPNSKPAASLAATVARFGAALVQPHAMIGVSLTLVCAVWFARPWIDLALTPQIVVAAAAGQTRQVTLPDGSSIELSGGTSLVVQMADLRRVVRMEQGEAFFAVAPDAERPFIVESGDGRVQVRGTAFDLSSTRDGLELAVHHGRVEFSRDEPFASSVAVSAGQRTALRGSELSAIERFDPESGDWRSGWLDTDGITLGGLAERLGRRHAVQVTVDSSLIDKRISGRFRLTDPEALLRSLSRIHGFTVTHSSAGLLVHPAP